MKTKKYKILVIFILFTFLLSSGLGCKWNPFAKDNVLLKPVTIQYWGVWDTPAQMSSTIKAYQATHPTIRVVYRNFRYEEYERKLLEAWADDRGPDVFAIPVTWLREYQKRITPAPKTLKVPVLEVVGSIKQEVVTKVKEFQGITATEVKRQFVPVVYDDVVINGRVYGLPYSVDTLATFYNFDILSKEGIAEPIVDFHDLVEQAPKITKATEGNTIFQSAVAMGGTDNIANFFDIFSSLMLQNGVDVKGGSFNPSKGASAQKFSEVFSFYTDFAKPGRATYSWNKDLDESLEMFATGKLAYFFGYSYQANQLRDRGLQFDWDITNFPQARGADGTKYYGDYWVNVVSKKSKNIDSSWNFVQSSAAKDVVIKYLKDNKRPTALRSLVDEQLKDDSLKVFASQVLTADNWYEGYDVILAKKYLADSIDSLLSGDAILDLGNKFLKNLEERINQTYREPNE